MPRLHLCTGKLPVQGHSQEETGYSPEGGLHALMGHMSLLGPLRPSLYPALSSHRQKIAALSRH